jgi:hypothetical protein
MIIRTALPVAAAAAFLSHQVSLTRVEKIASHITSHDNKDVASLTEDLLMLVNLTRTNRTGTTELHST